jgi:hypothetical protein
MILKSEISSLDVMLSTLRRSTQKGSPLLSITDKAKKTGQKQTL